MKLELPELYHRVETERRFNKYDRVRVKTSNSVASRWHGNIGTVLRVIPHWGYSVFLDADQTGKKYELHMFDAELELIEAYQRFPKDSG